MDFPGNGVVSHTLNIAYFLELDWIGLAWNGISIARFRIAYLGVIQPWRWEEIAAQRVALGLGIQTYTCFLTLEVISLLVVYLGHQFLYCRSCIRIGIFYTLIGGWKNK